MGFVFRHAHPELRVVALDVAHSGGTTWMCTPEECGAQRVRGRGEAAAELFTIVLHEELQPDGHHGSYWVGELHASPPAVLHGSLLTGLQV